MTCDGLYLPFFKTKIKFDTFCITLVADPTMTGVFQEKSQRKTDRALVSKKVICPQYLQKVAGHKIRITN